MIFVIQLATAWTIQDSLYANCSGTRTRNHGSESELSWFLQQTLFL